MADHNVRDALLRVDERFRHTREHIRRVLRKFPAQTVPRTLRWALNTHADVALRPSSDHEYLRLVVIPYLFPQIVTERASIPMRLLDAPEQDVHAWTRREYWRLRHAEQEAARSAARHRVTLLHDAAISATRAYEDAKRAAGL